MNNEKIRKTYWLEHLIKKDLNWIDGDTEDENLKTADLVNHSLKIAIELKIEESRDYWFPRFSSNRVIPYLKSANNKFKNYPNYKTILFIESNCTVEEFQTAESIIYQVKNGPPFIQNKRRANSSFNDVGSIIIWPYFKDVDHNYGYGWGHNEANINRKIDYQAMSSLLGIDIRHYLDSPEFSGSKKN